MSTSEKLSALALRAGKAQLENERLRASIEQNEHTIAACAREYFRIQLEEDERE